MSITQTVDIPPSHRLTIDVPPEIPAGRVLLTFTPVVGQRPGSTLKMSAMQEIEHINRNADRLNAEALDVLLYRKH